MHQQKNGSEEIVTDLVCGMKKPRSDMKTSTTLLGKIYYFCSEKDKELFNAHSDYWIPTEERDKARSV